MILELLAKYEPFWLLAILSIETTIGAITLYWIIKEYAYDEQKDIEKKQKRTKTTKKSTTSPSGVSTVEETTEISEPMEEKK